MTSYDLLLQKHFPNINESDLAMHKQLSTQKLLLYFKNRLNRNITAEQLETEYGSALFLLVSNAINFNANYSSVKGIKSISQGNKKTTFDESVSSINSGGAYDITDEIKELLPVAAVKLRG